VNVRVAEVGVTSLGLVPLDRVQKTWPDWPMSPWATGRLIRLGQLGAVRVGRRVFVTRELLDAFIARHTVDGGNAA
jgi:hypothetical protein